MIRLELHVHTHHSFDCMSSPTDVIRVARRHGYNGVAITDHNVYRVDLGDLQERFPDMILIPATEVGTTVGDVLAYFITAEIVEKDFYKVLEIIHQQGGLAVLAHPFQRGRDYPDDVFKLVDGVEAYNAQNVLNQQRCLALAKKNDKPVYAGSDAHFLRDIGTGINDVDISLADARNLNNLKSALLSRTTAYCRKGSALSPYLSQFVRLGKTILG